MSDSAMPALDGFSPATRAWFDSAFAAPTQAQEGAWQSIQQGRHTLVVAPTGSGKTLSAFLWAIDRLAAGAPGERRTVLYVSPLKALAVDVERNLRAPLTGVRLAAERLGLPVPEIRVATRSGDTSAADRRLIAKHPPDILITTPESLYLMLTSAAASALTEVGTVIIDEVHSVAGTKRGAHLAVTLERLDAVLSEPAQRIGLSATVNPVEEVARYLAGGRPVDIVAPPSEKRWDLRVVVPVDDMSDLSAGQPVDLSGPAAAPERRASIWPHVEERIVDLITTHRSTLVFANSRRLAERLTTRLNEIWQERIAGADAGGADHPSAAASGADGARADGAGADASGRHASDDDVAGSGSGIPAQLMGAAGAAAGAPAALARAHHGSVSKEQRALIEEDLKAGRLPAVVATSSLELGIDMGAVDLVIQVESPPSVASGLQRVGRAGHQVGAVSRGVVLPKFRGDLVSSAVVVERMRSGDIEPLRVPANPLDILAQQVVAMCALRDWTVPEVLELLRRTAPYASLTRPVLDAVLDMLAGRYPSEEFAELRPRLTWDRITDTLSGRRGAQHLAVTSGGTIPDRGLYAVMLASGDGPGRRVGELDEEMVYESRVGDVFTLGTSSWRIEDITHDRVLVSPAPGQPGRLPFWKGDSLGRPVTLGREVGRFLREVGAATDDVARERLSRNGLDPWAIDNLLAYLHDQREATGQLPSDESLVLERFRDELGDWRVAIHSPFGSQVHAPWALAVSARMRERFGVDVQAMHGDDGIIFRLPDIELDGSAPLPLAGDAGSSAGASDTADRAFGGDGPGRDLGAEILDLVMLDPDEVSSLVTDQIGGSALFAARFRECAARALLLPRRRPGQRQALWQQRQRSAALLQVAAQYPSFPIVLEAVRECVQDVFDVPALTELMRSIAARRVRLVDVETPRPSPFAQSLLFGYVAQYLYEGDSPLAERRAAALSLDPELLADLLGTGEGLALRDLLDPEAIARTEAELQHLTEHRRARDADEVTDLLRVLGPLTSEEIRQRTRPESRDLVPGWLEDLAARRRVIEVRIGSLPRWAAAEDAGRLRDALGASLPVGLPTAFLEPVEDPLAELVARYARTHGPFTVAEVTAALGLAPAVARSTVRRLVDVGRVVVGEFRPAEVLAQARGDGAAVPASEATEHCDAAVLRTIRRRSLAALRAEVEPVTAPDLARFLPVWQSVGTGALHGADGVARVVEQLSGVPVPASALESLILPARIPGYTPGLLDELMTSGEVIWAGHGALAGNDGWVSLHLAETAPLTLPAPPADASPAGDEATAAGGPVHEALLTTLGAGGAFFFPSLVAAARAALPDGPPSETAVAEALWDLVWAGRVTNDTMSPLRAVGARGRTAHRRTPSAAPRRGRYAGLRGTLGRPGSAGARGLGAVAGVGVGVGVGATTGRVDDARLGGRWSLLPAPVVDPTLRAHATAELLLDRYGVVTRGSVVAEEVPGGFAAVYRVLAAAEEAGRVRRGYFVEGLGAAQFGTTGAVDRLRAAPHTGAAVLAATDPANPFGAALPWPERPESQGHQPARKAGALVVIVDGALVLYVERGGRTVLTFPLPPDEVLDSSSSAPSPGGEQSTGPQGPLEAATRALAATVREGRLERIVIEKIDGQPALGSTHPLVESLTRNGFHPMSRGLRLRR